MPPERLARWVDGFRERHGGCGAAFDGSRLVLTGGDGSIAEVEVPWPPVDGVPAEHAGTDADPSPVVAALGRHAQQSRTALLVLVRRGGFAAGTARDGVLLAHAVGTRYVQGRTAAGGWSQQRFARRRSGQAAALAGSAVDAVLKVLASGGEPPQVLVTGGDRGLVAEVLADPRLGSLSKLPASPLLQVADPRLVVLQDVARRALSLRVRVTDPG